MINNINNVTANETPETKDSCSDKDNCPFIPLFDKDFTLFVHPSIRVSYINDDKQYGLIVNDDISIGTVLVVEDPWMYTTIDSSNDKFPFFKSKLDIINLIRNNKNVYKLYKETLATNNKLKNAIISTNERYDNILNISDDNQDNSDLNDLAIFETNSWGSGMYGILSKLNYGYPTNIVIFGGKDVDNVKKRIIIIATDNIKKNDELVYEYFDVFSNNNFDRLIKGYGITLDPLLDFNDLQNKYFNKIKAILSGNIASTNSFAQDMTKLYKNCITNWWIIPGGYCDKNLNSEELNIKNDFAFLINKGKIIQYALGYKKPETWMGQSFIDKYQMNGL